MKIAIDCRALRKRKLTGVANVLIMAINKIVDRYPHWKIYLLSNEKFSEEAEQLIPSNNNVIIIVQPLPIFKGIAIIWYLLKLNSIVKRLNVDVFFTPTPTLPFYFPANVTSLITVFDMVFKEHASTMSIGNWLLNFLLHDNSIRRADGIWTISYFTKDRLNHFFPNKKSQTILVGIGLDDRRIFYQSVSEDKKATILTKHSLQKERKTILFVGTLEPRKNLSFLISLMPQLGELGFQLLIVGAKGWKGEAERVMNETSSLQGLIHFAGYVDDDELRNLYQIADIYVSPSLNEGFGLPLLEAMQCGCPVVAARNSAMIEVVSEAGELVEGWNHGDWINAIETVSNNHNHYQQAGFKKAEKYDWKIIIENLNSYIYSLMKSKKNG